MYVASKLSRRQIENKQKRRTEGQFQQKKILAAFSLYKNFNVSVVQWFGELPTAQHFALLDFYPITTNSCKTCW